MATWTIVAPYTCMQRSEVRYRRLLARLLLRRMPARQHVGAQTWLAGMKKLTPPNVYLPPENLDDMRAALDVRPAQWFWSVRHHFPHRCDGIPRPTHASIKPK